MNLWTLAGALYLAGMAIVVSVSTGVAALLALASMREARRQARARERAGGEVIDRRRRREDLARELEQARQQAAMCRDCREWQATEGAFCGGCARLALPCGHEQGAMCGLDGCKGEAPVYVPADAPPQAVVIPPGVSIADIACIGATPAAVASEPAPPAHPFGWQVVRVRGAWCAVAGRGDLGSSVDFYSARDVAWIRLSNNVGLAIDARRVVEGA